MLLHSQFILREAKYHFFIYCMKKQKMKNINITNKYLYASIAKKIWFLLIEKTIKNPY